MPPKSKHKRIFKGGNGSFNNTIKSHSNYNFAFLVLIFLLILIIFFLIYQLFMFLKIDNSTHNDNYLTNSYMGLRLRPLNGVSSNTCTEQSCHANIFDNPYSPPLDKSNIDYYGLPQTQVNIPTRGFSGNFSQVGILTKPNKNEKDSPLILPIMGRHLANGRDKFQYYTMSNTGSVNTKLPIRVNGKSGSGEYGCDEIQNQDNIYVDGYNDTFHFTKYENSTFAYTPSI